MVDAAKALKDLDALVQGLLSTLPLSKPWQRLLVTHLEEASRRLQVPRLTTSLDRGNAEIVEEATLLLKSLRRADAHVASGRADQGTHSAVCLAVELALCLNRRLAA